MKARDIKIGADPEFFLFNTITGKNESCHTFMKGDKKKPYPLKNGAVQVDGTAVEFNIEAATNPADFASNIQKVLDQIRDMVPKEYKFEFKPHVNYDPNYFNTLPFQCVELGCDPDYDAHTGKVNPKPEPKGDYKTMRTGAGHIHIGWTNGKDISDSSHSFDARHVAKNVHSFFVSSSITSIWDKDNIRSKLYGSNAAYRPKSYGCEVRSPSNAWLNYPKLWPWLAETTQLLVEHMYETGRSVMSPYLLVIISDQDYYKRYKYNNFTVTKDEKNRGYFTQDTMVNAYNFWIDTEHMTKFPKLDMSMFT